MRTTVTVDDIVIDPALPSAIRVPRTDVVQMLGGEQGDPGT